MTTETGREQRVEHRQRVLKGATILTGMHNSEIKCTIRNMHENGAELKTSIEDRIPSEFLLYIPVDRICHKAVVRWRQDGRIGVMFVGTEPKPGWHYG